MKHSGISWIGDMPSHWTITRFKYCFTTGTGLNITKADLIDEGVAVISYGQIHAKYNSRTHLSDNLLRYIPESLTIGRGRSKLSRNDFVFADTSEDLEGCGNAAFIDTDKLVFAGYHTVIAHPYVDGDFRFLAYLFSTQQWRTQIQQRVSGVKVNSITRSLLNDSLLIVPPIPEQTAIADFLDTKCAEIDGLLEDLDAEVKTLAEYKKSIIAETVTQGLNPNVPMKQTGIQWAGLIPQHWKVQKGKYTFTLLQRPVKENDGVVTCFRDGEVTLRSNRREDGFTMSDKEYGYQGIEPGDLVVHGMDGFAGSIGISDSRGKGTPVLNVLDSEHNKRYLMYYLRNMAYGDVFLSLSTGIRVRSCDLSWKKLGEIRIVLPPIEEQNQIADYIDDKLAAIQDAVNKKLQQIDKLKEYKASLIYEYVTGKKQVI